MDPLASPQQMGILKAAGFALACVVFVWDKWTPVQRIRQAFVHRGALGKIIRTLLTILQCLISILIIFMAIFGVSSPVMISPSYSCSLNVFSAPKVSLLDIRLPLKMTIDDPQGKESIDSHVLVRGTYRD